METSSDRTKRRLENSGLLDSEDALTVSRATPDEHNASEQNPNKSGDSNKTSQSNFGLRIHFLWIVLGLYTFALIVLASTSSQYIVHRFQNELRVKYNVSGKLNESSACATNKSDVGYLLMQEAQQKAASFKIILSLFAGSPCIFTLLILGTYSDRIGRKVLFILASVGGCIVAAAWSIVSYWDLSLYIIYVSYIFDGLTGHFLSNLIGAFAFSSDITSGGKSRSFRIAVVESIGAIFVGLAELAAGYMIKAWGYTVPFIVGFVLFAINLLIIRFLLPETNKNTAKESPSFRDYLYRTFRFYISKQDGNPRRLFHICLVIFFLCTMVIVGRNGVDVLYMLNQPLCFDSVKIGYFGALHRVCNFLGAIAIVRLLQKCLSDSLIGVVAGLSFCLGEITQGLAHHDYVMYISAVIGLGSSSTLAMVRAIMSKLTAQGQHGAVFGSMAFIESVTTLTSGIAFNAIYKSTLPVYRGAVFFIMASFLLVAVMLFGWMNKAMKKYNQYALEEVENAIPETYRKAV